jgi:hypothetical protein
MTNVMNKFLIYLSIYFALHVSGFLLAPFQRQVYNFGSGPSLLGMVSAPGRWYHTQETWTTTEIVHLPLKRGLKKARSM